MSNLARQEMYYNHFYSLDRTDRAHRSRHGGRPEANRRGIFSHRADRVTILGNLAGLKLTRDQLAC